MEKQVKEQIAQSIDVLQDILGKDLLGVYLYGSALLGGLQKYSDIDLLVVSNRQTTEEEKSELVKALLTISGKEKRPIELTIVVAGEVNPWRYPPTFDFQYGEWLRDEFEKGNINLWPTKEMPDLAVLITLAMLANNTLYGAPLNQLLARVPYRDFIKASIGELDNLLCGLETDTRNVLLTLARIFCTITTDTIRSKADGATWALDHLPAAHKQVLERARAICLGQESERWEDILSESMATAQYLVGKIKDKAAELERAGEWDHHFIRL